MNFYFEKVDKYQIKKGKVVLRKVDDLHDLNRDYLKIEDFLRILGN
jgi:hypothetical protein